MSDNDSKKQGFVSRRGHQVGLNQIDMKDIDIDQDEGARPSDQVTPKKPEPQPRHTRGGWTRKKVIILSIVIALLLVPVLAGELVAAQYRTGVSGAKNDLAKVVSTDVLPAQKKSTVTADQIRSIAGKVNDIVTGMCRGGLVDNIAGLYPRAKSALDDCKTSQSKYAALVSGLYELENQARYLERVEALIKPVATPTTDEYAVIGAQQTAWQTAADGLKKLSPPDSMKATHAELVAHAGAVADNWSKLNTANNSQDGAGFTAAEKALGAEYEAVRATSAKFTTTITSTQTKITTNYSFLK